MWELTVDGETIVNPDARINIDVFPGFEAISFVDDNFQGDPGAGIPPDPPQTFWTGTLFGGPVEYVGQTFGRNFNAGLTLDVPTSIFPDDWQNRIVAVHYPDFPALGDLTTVIFEITDVFVGPGDEDNDGVTDDGDACSGTAEGVAVDATGCSIEQLCPRDKFKNHGQFVACTAGAAKDFLQNGLITKEEKKAIVIAAAQNK